jgi:NodT family efflux transporter outer membrane factor (OMF) lipoprotein
MRVFSSRCWTKLPTALSLSLLLGGCVAPLSIDTNVGLPDQYLSELNNAKLSATTIDNEQLVKWWEQFQDPLLTELIGLAIDNNKDIAMALARVDQARATELSSRAALLPDVGVSVDAQRHSGFALTTGTQVVRQWQADLQARWEVDLFGAGRERLSSARYQTQANIADMYAIRLSLAATTASLYLNYRGTQQQHEILQESLKLANEFYEIAARNFTYGRSQQTDVHLAKANVAQVEAQLHQADTQILQLRFSLENLCMLNPGSLEEKLAKPNALPNIPPIIAKGQPIDLLMRRPDLIAAQFRLQSMLAQGQAARDDYLPKLSLSALFGASGTRIGGISQGTDQLWLLGLSAVLPLFDFGTRRAQVELWDARTQEALLAYQKGATDALYDVERGILQLGRDQENQMIIATQVKERQKIIEQVLRQFEVGVAGRLDVAQARVTLLESQMAVLSQNVLQLQTQVALFRAFGGGWEVTPSN